jgi:hypothetical protein
MSTSTNTAGQRWYPKFPPDIVHPTVEHAIRLAYDHFYDLQEAIATLVGGATAQSTIAAGAVTGIMVMFPGFGYQNTPAVTLTGGGGTGAKAVAVIKNGKIASINVTAPGSGYTTPPIVELSQ